MLIARIENTKICPKKGMLIMIGARRDAVSPRSPAVQAPVSPAWESAPAMPGPRFRVKTVRPRSINRAIPPNIQKTCPKKP